LAAVGRRFPHAGRDRHPRCWRAQRRRIARGRPTPLRLGRARRDRGRLHGGARRLGDRRRRWPAQYETP